MASTTSLPMASANIWTNFVFFIAALVLAVYLIYYSIAPWYAGAGAANNNHRSGLWQTHRPKALRRFLLLTIASLITASLLNILFYVQGVPSSEGSNNDAGKGPTLRIPNLQLSGWLALRSLSNIFQQLPFVLLFLTLINILQSRWYTLHKHSTGHKVVSASSSTLDHDAAEYKFPAFLGWKGKEGCSFFVAFLLVFIPVLSNVLFSIGLSKYLSSNDVEALDNYSKVVKAVTFLDAWNCVMVIIAVADISVSSYFLFQQMRKSHYYDLTSAIISRIITPFLTVVALQTTIASSFHSFGNSSESTFAALDYVTFLLTTLAVAATTGFLLSSYQRPQRWMLASTQASANPGPTAVKLDDVSSVYVDLPELPKLSYLPSRDNMA